MNTSLAGLPPRPDPPKPAALHRVSSGVKWFQDARSGLSSGRPSSLRATASMLAGFGNLFRGHAPPNIFHTAPSDVEVDSRIQLGVMPPLRADPDDSGAEGGISHLEAATVSHLPLASHQPAQLARGAENGGREPTRQESCSFVEGGLSGQPNGHA